MCVDDKVQMQVGVSYTNSALYNDHRVLEVSAMESHALWSLCQALVGEAQHRLCGVLEQECYTNIHLLKNNSCHITEAW